MNYFWSKFKNLSTPWAWRYGMGGAILGLGAPNGLFLLRFFIIPHGDTYQWLHAEWMAMKWVYLYTGASTILAFFLFGYVLGKRNDALETLSKSLKKYSLRLERLSITDGLTNIYVHSYLIKRLEEELSRANRYQQSLACLFIDIDHFKRFNDRYGHLVGDQLLVAVTKAIASEVRESDILGRYGGDEFVVILPQTNKTKAFEVAERMRKNVASLSEYPLSKTIKITISIGIYAPHQLPTSSADILALADSALHEAKIGARNQTVIYGSKAHLEEKVKKKIRLEVR